MSRGLQKLIGDYQAAVRDAVARLEAGGIPRPATDLDWVCNTIAARGTLPDGSSYYKHGIGCAVKYPGGAVDFDFAEDGDISGFNPYRLGGFAGNRLAEYGFESEAEIVTAVKGAVANGDVIYPGMTLYFLAER